MRMWWRRTIDWLRTQTRMVRVDLDAIEAHLHRMDQQIGLVHAEPVLKEALTLLDSLAASSAVSPGKQRQIRQAAARIRETWREYELRAHALRIGLAVERRDLIPGSSWARALAPGEPESHTYNRRLPREVVTPDSSDRMAVVGERGGYTRPAEASPGSTPRPERPESLPTAVRSRASRIAAARRTA